MDHRRLKALVSSLVAQSLLFFLLSPSASPSLSPYSKSYANFNSTSLTVLCHFLYSQEVAASLCAVTSRKRRRTHSTESGRESSDEVRDPGIGQLGPARSPESFKASFGMSSRTFEWLLGLLEPLLECRDPVGSPINLSSEVRLGIGLNRLATGSSYTEVAGRFGATEPVARFCTKQLCRVLCTNFRFWVAFPGAEDLDSVSASFEELTGLANCCGVVDCVRFEVFKDGACNMFDEKPESNGLAMQIVVDSSSRILNIVAGFRGDRSKSNVLKQSTLYRDIKEKNVLNSSPVHVNGVEIKQYLIGDRDYPLLPWLMVPFSDAAAGSSEEIFNGALSRMRISALRTIASLRNWGALKEPIREGFKTAVGFIGACSILHNVLLMREDDIPLFEDLWRHSSSDDQSRGGRGNDTPVEETAVDIRNALAARVAGLHASIHDDRK